MISVDLGLLRVVIFIAVISLKRKCIGSKFVDVMIVLLIYMTDRDCLVVIIVDSINIHEECVNDDFVCRDRCS